MIDFRLGVALWHLLSHRWRKDGSTLKRCTIRKSIGLPKEADAHGEASQAWLPSRLHPQSGDKAADLLDALPVRRFIGEQRQRLLHLADDRAADNDSVRAGAHPLHLLPAADAESDGDRQRRRLAHRFQEAFEAGMELAAHARHAERAHAVDEALGLGGNPLDARLGGRRHERHEMDARFRRHLANLAILLDREVRDDQAADALLVEQGEKSLEAVLKHRIVVSKQDEGHLDACLPGFGRDIDACFQRNRIAQSSLGSLLNDRAVGKRIGIRHAELDHVGSSLLQLDDDIDRRAQIGVTGRDEWNERRPLLCLEPFEDEVNWIHASALRDIP
ncbi:hypothetical protein BN871_DT_00180 [Paenibacillus sp. P22]|nr:hypothetical protein BN871_DT_00180 [Paenibacillus sp. P22]